MASSAGQPAPDFTLKTAKGEAFTREQLLGRTTVLVFYPFAFSPVCTDQLSHLQRPARGLRGARARRSTASPATRRTRRRRSRTQLGIEIEQLSDFEPKGAACRAFGVYHPGGFPQRALVIVDPDGDRALELRGAVAQRTAGRQPDLRRALSDLGSAPLPARRPCRPRARRRAAGGRLRRLRVPVLRGFRRATGGAGGADVLPPLPGALVAPARVAAACAAEAAALQGAFWPMHDALFADQGRLEDPHLWARAEALGLDVERFDADRRSEAVVGGVKATFRGGVRAGVATTPTAFLEGRIYPGRSAAGVGLEVVALDRRGRRLSHGRRAARPGSSRRRRRGDATPRRGPRWRPPASPPLHEPPDDVAGLVDARRKKAVGRVGRLDAAARAPSAARIALT